MYWLDTAILLILGFGAILGAMTGLIWQVARIASLGASLYACIFFNEWVTELLLDVVLQGADPRVAKALAYALVFLVVFVVLYIATRVLHYGIRAVDLEGLDRVLGAVVGVGKMAIILAGLSYCLNHYNHPQTRELLEQSTLAPILAEGMQYVLVAIPQEYKDDLGNNLNNLREWARNKKAKEPGSMNQGPGPTDPEIDISNQGDKSAKETGLRVSEGPFLIPDPEVTEPNTPGTRRLVPGFEKP